MAEKSSFWSEFKTFIARGNVMDMAVGVVVGGAFTAIVNSLVGDIINPLIGKLFGGVDLSGTTDLTAAKAIFQIPESEKIFVVSMYWLPEDLLERRVSEDKIPYDLWHEQGLLRLCPGNKINPHEVTEWFVE